MLWSIPGKVLVSAVGGVEDTDVDLTANDEGSSPTVFFSFHSYYIYYFLK